MEGRGAWHWTALSFSSAKQVTQDDLPASQPMSVEVTVYVGALSCNVSALVDSGVASCFISTALAKRPQSPRVQLPTLTCCALSCFQVPLQSTSVESPHATSPHRIPHKYRDLRPDVSLLIDPGIVPSTSYIGLCLHRKKSTLSP